MNILCPISPGELFDKITILEIKQDKIKDPAKNRNIIRELSILKNEQKKIIISPELANIIDNLRNINTELWEIEDNIRECELKQTFDTSFIQLARSVYKNNDKRSKLKYSINVLLNSAIVEEKSYKEY